MNKRKINFVPGQRFGMLTILKELPVIENKYEYGVKKVRRFLCKCDCGNEAVRIIGHFFRVKISSCGCYHPKKLNLQEGDKFNRWTVISFHGIKVHPCGRTSRMYNCRCECGNIGIVSAPALNRGTSRSCGCLTNEKRFMSKNKHHGLSKTRFWSIWCDMRKRCRDKKTKCYHRYGGRGISVSERWLSFNHFKNDMYESYLIHVQDYGEKETTIDRIDNNGNYCPENCRWATYLEQAHNH